MTITQRNERENDLVSISAPNAESGAAARWAG
jgi:hypothetical protein